MAHNLGRLRGVLPAVAMQVSRTRTYLDRLHNVPEGCADGIDNRFMGSPALHSDAQQLTQ
jgi:hypothetical protein